MGQKIINKGQREASFAPISFELQPNDKLASQQILNWVRNSYRVAEESPVL
jgi:hypothetical protein